MFAPNSCSSAARKPCNGRGLQRKSVDCTASHSQRRSTSLRGLGVTQSLPSQTGFSSGAGVMEEGGKVRQMLGGDSLVVESPDSLGGAGGQDGAQPGFTEQALEGGGEGGRLVWRHE